MNRTLKRSDKGEGKKRIALRPLIIREGTGYETEKSGEGRKKGGDK